MSPEFLKPPLVGEKVCVAAELFLSLTDPPHATDTFDDENL